MRQFRIKNLELRIKVFLSCFLLALFLILAALFYNPTHAQTATCGGGTPERAQGLVTTPSLSGKFGTSATGRCVTDSRTAFAPYKIPTYDDLKSLYYDQSKVAATSKHVVATAALPATFPTGDHLYYRVGDIDVSSHYRVMEEQTDTVVVIFIDGNLNIRGNIYVNRSTSAMVFVVKGKINISRGVERIDAVLIADGSGTAPLEYYSICTSYDTAGSSCPTALDDAAVQSQLVIYGSLISLNPSYPIRFRRSLSNNNRPAEQVNHNPKYLVILRNLLSDTYQKWSEIP